MGKNKFKKFILFSTILIAVSAIIGKALNEKEEMDSELTNESTNRSLKQDATLYEKYIKRALDICISAIGLVFAAPIIAVSCVMVFIEDPGNPIFTQKRVGTNKSHFLIHKLRSMKQNTGDVPTHLLSKEAQDNLILKTGKIFRKLSIDELPQLLDILRGRMTLVGPRPALWNQDDLIAERDKYGANDVKPGLTGWAQINGRDELEIPVKAKLDGEYVKALRKNSLSGFIMDCRCFFGTITSVLSSKGVVEGGTGSKKKAFTDAEIDLDDMDDIDEYDDFDPDSEIGFGDEQVNPDFSQKKKVLITGKSSYLGTAFSDYVAQKYHENYDIDTISLRDRDWENTDFSKYDVVLHMAGIAHADIGGATEAEKEKYYGVNTELAVKVAEKVKEGSAKKINNDNLADPILFVFMSSMIVYGDSAPLGKDKVITGKTSPKPANFYGDSKWQADKQVRLLADDSFKVAVIRPPMIYGPGCKGNYNTLRMLASKLPVFPNAKNQRSMLYVGTFCEFLAQMMLVPTCDFSAKGNVFFPQNREYVRTAKMVSEIAKAKDAKKILPTNLLNAAIQISAYVPGKIGALANKAFGNFCYEQQISEYPGIDYRNIDFAKTIEETENKEAKKASEKVNLASKHSGSDWSKETIMEECDTKPLPKVSIITVSYNSEKTIKKTIESVLGQNYKKIEYHIVDGGSTDRTVEIAESYAEKFVSKGMELIITSERDGGIYDAMNKGIKASTGEIIGIINSDDWYSAKAVRTAAKAYMETDFDYYYADVKLVKEDGSAIIKHSREDTIATSRHWNHPSCFVAKRTYDELGLFKNEGIHDDFDFFLRVRRAGKRIVIQNKVIANFRTGGASNDKSLLKAKKRIADRYKCYKDNGYSSLYIIECIGIEAAKMLII